MKIIVVGAQKTGTISMKAALEVLGYSVCGYFDSFFRMEKEWEKIYSVGGTTEDFYKMFKDVDAVLDLPGSYFWDEILKAFPNAKNAPKDQLLIYDVKQGWEPLCEFLGKTIPNQPFPHENVGGEVVKNGLSNRPFFIYCRREMHFVITFMALLSVVGTYKFGKILWRSIH